MLDDSYCVKCYSMAENRSVVSVDCVEWLLNKSFKAVVYSFYAFLHEKKLSPNKVDVTQFRCRHICICPTGVLRQHVTLNNIFKCHFRSCNSEDRGHLLYFDFFFFSMWRSNREYEWRIVNTICAETSLKEQRSWNLFNFGFADLARLRLIIVTRGPPFIPQLNQNLILQQCGNYNAYVQLYYKDPLKMRVHTR